jgi:hypothetical protein
MENILCKLPNWTVKFINGFWISNWKELTVEDIVICILWEKKGEYLLQVQLDL